MIKKRTIFLAIFTSLCVLVVIWMSSLNDTTSSPQDTYLNASSRIEDNSTIGQNQDVSEDLSECQEYYRSEFLNAEVYGTFEEYPFTDVYTGPIATVNKDSGDVANRFYTNHKNALEGGVNFAGRYVISDWGFTGIGQMFAVVDVETGDVFPFPYVVDWDFDFRSESNLIVINPVETMPDFGPGGDFDCEAKWYSDMKTYYFLFEDSEFRLLGPEDVKGLRKDSRLIN